MKLAALLLAFVSTAGIAATQAEYPSRPIRLIVPSAPGGGPDVTVRILAAELVKVLGQNIVVENRPGASGTIGTEAIVRATADGYTFGQGNFTTVNTSRILLKLPYDVERDLQPIVWFTAGRNLLAIKRAMQVTSVPELIAHAKQNPRKIMYGSSGNGTSMHFSGALFGLLTGVEMMHVPYKAAQGAITDIAAGQIHLIFDNMPSVVPHVKSGRLRGLAVTSLARAPSLPDLPTVSESVPGFEVVPWGGFVAPAGVPRPIVIKLNAAINKVFAMPAFRDRITDLGTDIRGGTPEEFWAHVRREFAKWSEVAKRANVRIE
jgi:tripartite-type tricarboxylate transporter receptor subunit TctC